MQIVAVTGSKGKTTLTRLLSQAFRTIGADTLRIDGQEVARNEKVITEWTQKRSKDIFGLALSVCPGKLLSLADSNSTAIIEASIGCWRQGTGYDVHQIGVFTNVFEEHLSPKRGIRTIGDVANAKSFIFSKIAHEGVAVINLDDPHVLAQATIAHQNRPDIRYIGYSQLSEIESSLCEKIVCLKDGRVVLRHGQKSIAIVNVADISWTFDGRYQPSVYNLMALCGALVAYYGEVTGELIDAVKHSHLDEDGGRLTVLKDAKRDVTLLLDYAHEPQSLKDIIGLARSLSTTNKVIGVVRTSPRPDSAIASAAEVFATHLDEVYIYNKYDGVLHKARDQSRVELSTKAANTLTSFIIENEKTALLFDREDEALLAALQSSSPGDVIFHMVHDNAKSSVDLAKRLVG
jgi:UDP-N-acetylmuramyl tripeptide synthase